MNRSMLVLAFAFSVTACGTDGTLGDCTPGETLACDCSAMSAGTMTCGADSSFGACGQCSDPDPDPLKVNFKAEIVPILNKSCGTGTTGCHGRDAYAATVAKDCRGWLSLENASLGSKYYSGDKQGQATNCPDVSLYQRLMRLAVWQCATATAYVTPGNPGASYIMNKLNGTNLCSDAGTVTQQMPPPQTTFTISASDKALIQRWITEGALDN